MAVPCGGSDGVREQMLFEQPLVREDVVADEEHELAGRLVDPAIAGSARPLIALFEIPDSKGPGRRCHSLLRPVGRSVVHDHDFELLGKNGLTLQRVEARQQLVFPVVGRDDDADAEAQPVGRALGLRRSKLPRACVPVAAGAAARR